MRIFYLLRTLVLITGLLFHNSCNNKPKNKKEKEDGPKPVSILSTNYDLVNPVKKWVLSDSLAEISGITFLKNDRLLAIEDLRPILYELMLGDSSASIVSKTEFRETDKEKFDFEDIAVALDT